MKAAIGITFVIGLCAAASQEISAWFVWLVYIPLFGYMLEKAE